ncbi:MAG: condensation domain-containing protein, partial [Acidimicrobiales bacterium]|nr:condensation domain-containing protein [Acidimicrobiales bacterium]
HHGLRQRVRSSAPGLWALEIEAPGSLVAADIVQRVDMAGLGDAARNAVYAAQSTAAVDRLDPETGRTLQVVWFDAGHETSELLVVAHALVADRASADIVSSDLAAALAGDDLAPVGTHLRSWGRTLAEAAHGAACLAELDHWTATLAAGGELLADGPDGAAAPPATDRPAAGDVGGSSDAGRARYAHDAAPARDSDDGAEHVVVLSAEDSAPALGAVPAAVRAMGGDVVATALVMAVEVWRRRQAGGSGGPADAADAASPGGNTGQGADAGQGAHRALVVDVDHTGRPAAGGGPLADADVARTVGPLAGVHPVRLTPVGGGGLAALKAIKEQRRAAPDGGLGFGLLRHLNPQTSEVLAGLPRPQVLWHHDDACRADIDPVRSIPAGPGAGPGRHLLELHTAVHQTAEGPRLHARWVGRGPVRADDLAALADHWQAALRDLAAAARGLAPGAGGLPPSALRAVALDQPAVDGVEAAFARPVEDIWPLSPLQEGLFFHASFDAGALDVYTVQDHFDLGRVVDLDRLRAALAALLRRNPTLRAAFLGDGLPRPVQAIVAVDEVPMTVLDLSDLDTEAQVRRVDEVMAAERERHFDLVDPPLFHVTVLQLGPARCRLVVSRHLLLWDGWSGQLVFAELFRLYEQAGDDAGLATSGSYRDYLEWVEAQDEDAARAAWRTALDGLDQPTLVAPVSGAPTPVLPDACVTELSAELSERVRDLARRHGPHNVGLLTGDNSINGDAPVVVMTTEVLRNMIYAGSPALEGLRFVVLAEVHYLQDTYRGPVWEEVIIHLPEAVSLVCLSATVSNAEEVADWLTTVRGATRLILEEERPVELRNLYLVGDRQSDQPHLLPTLVDGRPNPEAERLDNE